MRQEISATTGINVINYYLMVINKYIIQINMVIAINWYYLTVYEAVRENIENDITCSNHGSL